MPAVTISDLGLTDATPADLERRRAEITEEMRAKFNGRYDELPESLLSELAVITAALRRKNSGPPKAKRPAKVASTGPKPQASDFVV